MANEAILVMELDRPIPFTVADGTAITKGALCKMSSPMTAAATSAALDQAAGILYGDKIASNGQTKAGFYRRGIFLVYISGSASAGDILVSDAVPNMLKSGMALTQFQISGTRVWGHLLEDATTGQQKLAYIDIRAENGA